MRQVVFFVFISVLSFNLFAQIENVKSPEKANTIKKLERKVNHLHAKIIKLEQRLKNKKKNPPKKYKPIMGPNHQFKHSKPSERQQFHKSEVIVHTPEVIDPESLEFYPTALVAEEHVVTYIAGTPVITSPYLGNRPAFDGSDYIVNISSINRDVRLLQQRRRLYRTYEKIGYPGPNKPILAISGAVQPLATIGDASVPWRTIDLDLANSEIDFAAILNDKVEGYMALAYDPSPPQAGGQRVANSSVDLKMGFVNIGDLDETPFYFTAGQIYIPFGRYSTSMVSATLPMVLARAKERPFILGYKSQADSGPYAALYGFKGDTTLGSTGVGGLNIGYVIDHSKFTADLGAGFLSSINDAMGMQYTSSAPNTTFGGFSSITNGNENVKKIPAINLHGNLSVDRFSLTGEWVTVTEHFRPQDLSFNGHGALPQAGQLEAGVTFKAFDKPSSFSAAYQWTEQALALNLPRERINFVFNISIWKDTVESLEYRHDTNYGKNQYANGAAAVGYTNANTVGQGGSDNMLLAQIAVYF